jgi:hypothetical protein
MSLTVFWTGFWFLVAFMCAIIATTAFTRILDEVNKNLPPSERFGILLGYPGFHHKVMKLHQVRFPESRRRRVVWTCILIGFTAVVFAVVPWWWAELSGGVRDD